MMLISAGAKKGDAAHDKAEWSVPRAVATLVAASVLAAWMSEILVGRAERDGSSHHVLGR